VDSRVDQLTKSIAGRNQIMICRGRDFLQWWYSQDSGHSYRVFILEEGDKLKGVVVLLQKGEGLWSIMDFLCEEDRVFGEIIERIIFLGVTEGFKRLEIFINDNSCNCMGWLTRRDFSEEGAIMT